jgi:hypothetical protein
MKSRSVRAIRRLSVKQDSDYGSWDKKAGSWIRGFLPLDGDPF